MKRECRIRPHPPEDGSGFAIHRWGPSLRWRFASALLQPLGAGDSLMTFASKLVSRAAAVLVISAAHGASEGMVINEAYGGGGNSGSTYTNDFVELYNI